MAKYGNTNVSSLMSAAKSAMAKRVTLEDSIASYEYDLSPKDQAAYQKYVDHLSGRLQQYQGVDPAKALSYQKALTTANRGFTSSEISRQSTQILYGNQSPQGKLQTLIGLYQRAIENGDENLAQRLEGQAASLQQTIMSAGRGGGGGGGFGGGGSDSATQKASAKALDQTMNELDSAEKQLKLDYSTGRIDRVAYGNKLAQLYDAKDKTLSGAYTLDENGNPVASGYDLTPEKVQGYFNKHNELKNNDFYQSMVGTNPNLPLDVRARIASAKTESYFDPMTGQIKTVKNNIVGLSPFFMGTNDSLPITDNGNTSKYQAAFNKIGIPTSNFDKGKLNQVDLFDTTYATKDANGNPITGDHRFRGDVYVDNPDNPTYAYTQDIHGARYAIDKNGNAILMQERNDPNNPFVIPKSVIAQQPAGGPNILGINKEDTANNPFVQYVNSLPGRFDEAGKEIDNTIGNAGKYLGQVFNSKNANDVIGKINQASSFLGHGSKMGSVGGFMSNPMRFLGDIGQLAMKATGLGQQVEAKKQADAANAAAEAARQQVALQASIAQAKANLPKPAQAPYKPAPQYSPSYGTVGNIQQGFTADPFSKAGIGTGSLYRL